MRSATSVIYGSPAKTVSEDEWYCLDEEAQINADINKLGDSPNPLNKKAVKAYETKAAKLLKRLEAFEHRRDTVRRGRELGCKSLPEPPCDVYRTTPLGSSEKIAVEWDTYRPTYLASHGHPSGTKTNHRVPKTAGGCPGNASSEGNLAHDSELSPECLKVDDELGKAQDSAASIWHERLGGP